MGRAVDAVEIGCSGCGALGGVYGGRTVAGNVHLSGDGDEGESAGVESIVCSFNADTEGGVGIADGLSSICGDLDGVGAEQRVKYVGGGDIFNGVFLYDYRVRGQDDCLAEQKSMKIEMGGKCALFSAATLHV